MFKKLLCFFNIHGPEAFGVGDHPRSRKAFGGNGFLRRCDVCGTKWAGGSKFVGGYKIIGQIAWRELPRKV